MQKETVEEKIRAICNLAAIVIGFMGLVKILVNTMSSMVVIIATFLMILVFFLCFGLNPMVVSMRQGIEGKGNVC